MTGKPLEVLNLSKRYGPFYALKDLSFEAERGMILLLLGPNGAGKTTLLRLLAGTSVPSGGNLRVFGENPRESPSIRRRIGFVSHKTFLYDALSGYENLTFFGKLFGVPNMPEALENAAARFGIRTSLQRPVGEYSRGMKVRLTLARTFLHDPDRILLDAPFAGLDLEGIELLEGVLTEARKTGKTLLLATHDLKTGISLADRVLLLKRGRLTLDVKQEAIREEELRRHLLEVTPPPYSSPARGKDTNEG